MSIDSRHPLYDKSKEDWIQMRDLYDGERTVKEKGSVYLRPTAGMELDGMKPNELGAKTYTAYVMRAVLPDSVKEAVETYIGMMHQKPATIELPSAMEPLRDRATQAGESLQLLLRRINEEQLVTGRAGVLLDLPAQPDQSNPLPYIAFYPAETIINWDAGEAEEGEARLNLVVLDESGVVRINHFEWQEQSKYRVLLLGAMDENEPEGTAVYRVGVFTATGEDAKPEFVETSMVEPQLRGKRLERIPFVFINTKDIVTTPDKPPLLGLGNRCLTIYRGEADYRQNLFMQGQDTLVVIGEYKRKGEDPNEMGGDSEPLRTGAGSCIELQGDGDAKYIGVESSGLEEQRTALENDYKRVDAKSGQLVNNSQGRQESGEALGIRVAAGTASLKQIALTGAAALQHVLRACAEWMGANPEEVVVTPNLEFARYTLVGQDLTAVMAAKIQGAPISAESIHAYMADRGLTKLDYESEMKLLQSEDPADTLPRGPGASNPDGE